jgi:hypothetical protein
MKNYHIELTLIEEILGTVPKDKDIYDNYIRSKAPPEAETEDELETIEEIEIKGWTGFHMVKDQPILYNYVLKGYFKDACGMLRRVPGTLSSKLKAYKKVIDGLLFVTPRKIDIAMTGAETGINDRPLRVTTPQGERVALARSDTCPAGSIITFDMEVLGAISLKLLKEWLAYGAKRGLGQWRNAGYGSFTYKLTETK